MRAIKFRGKRVDNGEWVYGWFVKGECAYIITKKDFYNAVVSLPYSDGLSHLSTEVFQVIPETVGQYIGLEDSSARSLEVYEEDIICYGGSYDFSGHKAVVKFWEGQFCIFRNLTDEFPLDMSLWKCLARCRGHVIGNVHDTPIAKER
ncbi:MAG: hypothetical protein KAS32_10495 [Candidatus Peribacteraceae bacterium]|nr:hypothetical protein [Candidatus Peribacteraceae bacterium]